MDETPIKDAISATTRTAHVVGWVNGRNTMKRDVLAILWSIQPRTKGVAAAIDRVSQLRIHIEGEKK